MNEPYITLRQWLMINMTNHTTIQTNIKSGNILAEYR